MFTGDATQNIGLPQWKPGDHPSWLEDMNPAFSKIDEHIGTLTGTANEASKLIKEIIPIVQQNTENITSLDTREESDRAYLQQQVDALKNADIMIHGLIDALQSSTVELDNFTKNLDLRLKEEEGTTAGFSSAAGNTIMDRFTALQKDLTTTTTNLRNLTDDFNEHVSDFNRKYSDLSSRMVDAEGNITVLQNRVQALEDWKSPFSQQVDELEKQYGRVTTEVVDLHKRLDILTDRVINVENDIDELRAKDTQQDKRISDTESDVSELHAEVHQNAVNITAIQTGQTEQDTAIANIEAEQTDQNTAIANIVAGQAEQNSSIADLLERVTALENGEVIDLGKLNIKKLDFETEHPICFARREDFNDPSTGGDNVISEIIPGSTITGYQRGYQLLTDKMNEYDYDSVPEGKINTFGTLEINAAYALHDDEKIYTIFMQASTSVCVVSNGATLFDGGNYGVNSVIPFTTEASDFIASHTYVLNGIEVIGNMTGRMNGIVTPTGYRNHTANSQEAYGHMQVGMKNSRFCMVWDNAISVFGIPANSKSILHVGTQYSCKVG